MHLSVTLKSNMSIMDVNFSMFWSLQTITVCILTVVYSPNQALNTQQQVYMAIQIARGVQYLHRRRIIHRDIATRNCM